MHFATEDVKTVVRPVRRRIFLPDSAMGNLSFLAHDREDYRRNSEARRVKHVIRLSENSTGCDSAFTCNSAEQSSAASMSPPEWRSARHVSLRRT